MKPGDLSIVILAKNGGELFQEVLAGLFACEGIHESEVLVIDSGSSDRTLEYAANYPQIRIHRIPPEEFGHGKTRNLGARMTTRPVMVFLVQDATPATADFLSQLTAPLTEERLAGVFGRQLPRPWTNKIERVFLEATYPDRAEVKSSSKDQRLRIKDIFFSNVCSAIHRDVWEKIPFDESLIMSEDQLWAKQVLMAGYRIGYQPSATVFHSHNYSLKDVFKRNFDSGVSLVGISEDSFLSMAKYELQHIAWCAAELIRRGDFLWLPYLLVYEAIRAVAFATGQRAHLLPGWLRRRLSLHKYHWDDSRAVAA